MFAIILFPLTFENNSVELGMTPSGGTRTSESWHLESLPRQLHGVYACPVQANRQEKDLRCVIHEFM